MKGVIEKMDSTAKADTATAASPIGQLLISGELIVPQDLEFALEHQKYSKELLGQILVRIGALQRDDLNKVLSVQSAFIGIKSNGHDD